MSEEQKRDQSGSPEADMQKPKAEGEASAPMSGEPAAVDGAEVTKTGGAGEPPGGYASADAPKPKEPKASAAASEPVEPQTAKGEPGDAPAAEKAAPSDAEKEAKAAAEARAAG